MLLFRAFSCPQTSLCVLVLHLPSAPPAGTPMLLQGDPHAGSCFPPSLLPCCHQNLGGRLCHPQMLSPRATSGLGHGTDTWQPVGRSLWSLLLTLTPRVSVQRGEWAVSAAAPIPLLPFQSGSAFPSAVPHTLLSPCPYPPSL